MEKRCDNTSDCDDSSDERFCAVTVNPIESETDFKFGNNDVDGSGGQGDGFTGLGVSNLNNGHGYNDTSFNYFLCKDINIIMFLMLWCLDLFSFCTSFF